MLTFDTVLAVVSQPALMVILMISAGLAWPLGRRTSPDRPRLGALFVLTLGAVLAATAITVSWRPSPALIPSYLDGFGDPAYLVGDFAGTREKIANIGLFLPLGLVGGLLWRRHAVLLGLFAALTFMIELWQAFIGRGGDAVDVVHNTAGAILGLGVAWLTGRAGHRTHFEPGPSGPDPGRARYQR